jgi:hypothetical protein
VGDKGQNRVVSPAAQQPAVPVLEILPEISASSGPRWPEGVRTVFLPF